MRTHSCTTDSRRVTTSSGVDEPRPPSASSSSAATMATTTNRTPAATTSEVSTIATYHARREPRRRLQAMSREIAALIRTLTASVSELVAPSGPSEGTK